MSGNTWLVSTGSITVILSLFSHFHVVPNPHEFLFLLVRQKVIFFLKNILDTLSRVLFVVIKVIKD